MLLSSVINDVHAPHKLDIASLLQWFNRQLAIVEKWIECRVFHKCKGGMGMESYAEGKEVGKDNVEDEGNDEWKSRGHIWLFSWHP